MLISLRKSKNREVASDKLTDAQLIDAYVSEGNTDYFGLLFERYTHLVFGVCMKYLKNTHDAEDAVLGIFEKLLTDLKKHEVLDFKNWLYRVTKNHCLMILRKRKVKDKAEGEIMRDKQQEFMEIVFDEHLPNEDMDVEGILISLRGAMNELREEQRTCIELMYLEKKTYQEVSHLTGYSLKQVKSYIQNGKRNLKNMIIPK
ncbi:MAG: sigma-70 family RNA polymerase sigma factor [Bacteroidales bacterium]|nr:sigma-70 family RNA polymerase sigma factor [Bacteroidales bacterium]